MATTFSKNRNRFASFGTISNLPSEIIDSLWIIIDLDLKGTVALQELITFNLTNNHGKLTVHFSQDDASIEMGIDLPFKYSENFPNTIYAFDDGNNQTLLLPEEINQHK
ncbi:MAG: DUF960 domain-containing protein [Lactobacillales bacterium]|jgi:hypothetical protein|nr:DUF960 domain-containing protein [Lactobacillales bacterium]